MIVPEEKINGTIENSITTKCDFCEERIHVNQNDPKDMEKKTEGWKNLYCLGKKHHILNICPNCVDNTKADTCQDMLKCPYDNCTVISKQEKERLEKHGIKLVDRL